MALFEDETFFYATYFERQESVFKTESIFKIPLKITFLHSFFLVYGVSHLFKYIFQRKRKI